jgi:Na+/alanine symporter
MNVEPDRAFLPSLNQRIAAIVESPTKRTLGFTRGAVVVVVVVVDSMVVSVTTEVVVVVVDVDTSALVPGSAPETEDPILMANAAHNKPAINRVLKLFITLTPSTR